MSNLAVQYSYSRHPYHEQAWGRDEAAADVVERGGGHGSAATGRDEVAADDSFLRVGALGGTGHAPFLGAVAAKWKVDFLMGRFRNART